MSTDLVPLDLSQYPALSPAVASTLQENLQGEELSPGDLTRIKVPAQGATLWQVPDCNGEPTAVKEIVGVIVHQTRRRALWPSADPTGDPPACSSTDCVTGIGDPGGACAKCPQNQFGTATKRDGSAGAGKACKETRLLFLLREESVMPEILVVPSGSLRPVRTWLMKLPHPYWSYRARFTLKTARSKGGIDYAEIVPSIAGRLDKDTIDRIRSYAQSLGTVFAQTTVDQDDVEPAAGTPRRDTYVVRDNEVSTLEDGLENVRPEDGEAF